MFALRYAKFPPRARPRARSGRFGRLCIQTYIQARPAGVLKNVGAKPETNVSCDLVLLLLEVPLGSPRVVSRPSVSPVRRFQKVSSGPCCSSMERQSPSPPPPPPPAAPAAALPAPPPAREDALRSASQLSRGTWQTKVASADGAKADPVAPASPRGARLERVLGITAAHNSSLALNPRTGEIAYPAGRIVVLYDPSTGQQSAHFHGSKTVSALCWSADGTTLAVGERGHHPGIALWRAKEGGGKRKYQKVLYLMGHSFGVKCLAFDRTGRFLVSVGFKHDHGINVWDCFGGLCTGNTNIGPPGKWGRCKRVAMGRFTKRVHSVVFASRNIPMNPLEEPQNTPAPSATNTFMTIADDGGVEFWSFPDTHPSHEVLNAVATDDETKLSLPDPISLSSRVGGLPKAFHSADFVDATQAADGRVYCVTLQGVLCAFSSEGMMEKWVNLDGGSAYAIAAGTHYITAACTAGIVRVFRVGSLRYVGTLPKPAPLLPRASAENADECTYPAALCVTLDAADKHATVVYANRRVSTWNLSTLDGETGAVLMRSNMYHSGCVWDVHIPSSTPSRMHVESCGHDVHIGGGRDAAPSPGGDADALDSSVLTCSTDGTIRFWDIDGKARSIGTDDPLLHTLYVNADSDTLAPLPTAVSPASFRSSTTKGSHPMGHSGSLENPYDAELPPVPAAAAGVRCLDVSPDGRWIASGDRTGNVRIHDLRTMETTTTLPAHDAEVLTVAFAPRPPNPRPSQADFSPVTAPTTTLLASGGRDHLVKVYDARDDYEAPQTLKHHSASVMSVKFALNGSRVLSCGGDRTVVIAKTKISQATQPDQEGVEITKDRTIMAPYGAIYDMALHENDRWVITSGEERKVQVWSLFSGKRLRSWKPTDGRTDVGPEVELYKIKLDSTGTYAAACSFDKQIRIYDFLSGTCVARFSGHSELVTGLAFTADCRRLVTVGGDGCIFVWRLPSAMSRAMRERRDERKRSLQVKLRQSTWTASPESVVDQLHDSSPRDSPTGVVTDGGSQSDEDRILSPKLEILPEKAPEPKRENRSVQSKREKADGVVPINGVDKGLMVVGQRIMPVAKPTSDTPAVGTAQSTISTIGSDLPTWAKTANTTMEVTNLPTWAKTAGNVVDEAAAESAANVLSEESDGETSGTEAGDIMDVKEIDSPPRIMAPKSLLEERRSLAMRQRGMETNAAVADMRSKLAALGILPQTQSVSVENEPTADDDSGRVEDEETAAVNVVVAEAITTVNKSSPTEMVESAAGKDSVVDDGCSVEDEEALAVGIVVSEMTTTVNKSHPTENVEPVVPNNSIVDDGCSVMEDEKATTSEIVIPETTPSIKEPSLAEKLEVAADGAASAVEPLVDSEVEILAIEPVIDTVVEPLVGAEAEAPKSQRKGESAVAEVLRSIVENVVPVEMVAHGAERTISVSLGDKGAGTSTPSGPLLTIETNEGRPETPPPPFEGEKSTLPPQVSEPFVQLQPPTSSASPKRRVEQNPLRLSMPAEAYRESLANLRSAFSNAMQMYKEVDTVRHSLPVAPERNGVEKLLQEFQNEFSQLLTGLPQKNKATPAQAKKDEEHEDHGEVSRSESSSESEEEVDEKTVSMLLALAQKMKKKKKKRKRQSGSRRRSDDDSS